ncbi:hypothetical protein CPC698_0612A, partial [Chlamydia psittaci C6/98]
MGIDEINSIDRNC